MKDVEKEWLQAAVAGDANAFGELVESYHQPVYNLCYRMLGDHYEAEDAAQEAFFRAYKSLGRQRHPGAHALRWSCRPRGRELSLRLGRRASRCEILKLSQKSARPGRSSASPRGRGELRMGGKPGGLGIVPKRATFARQASVLRGVL